MSHPLHIAVAESVEKWHAGLEDEMKHRCTIIKAQECLPVPEAKQQNIPLFYKPLSKDVKESLLDALLRMLPVEALKSNEAEFCNVDIMILLDGKMKVFIEIEESANRPGHVFGKYLGAACASIHVHESYRNVPLRKDDAVLFIQVLDTSELKEGSSKREQWDNVARAIASVIRSHGAIGDITTYRLLYGDEDDFRSEKGDELVRYVDSAIRAVTWDCYCI